VARKSQHPPIVCEFFTWKLFKRHGVHYADGRTGKLNLGKHSLGTKDAGEALDNLRQLDRQMAVQRGLAAPAQAETSLSLPLRDGWDLFLTHCQRPEIMGGVSPRSVKRYGAVRDKHQDFCEKRGINYWADITKKSVENYGQWLDSQGYSPRSLYLELTLIKSVVLWLIGEARLPPGSQLKLELDKPQGTKERIRTATPGTRWLRWSSFAERSPRWLGSGK
jgi:hypothetical protein